MLQTKTLVTHGIGSYYPENRNDYLDTGRYEYVYTTAANSG